MALIKKPATEKHNCLAVYLEAVIYMGTDLEELVLLYLCVLKFSETFLCTF